MNKAASVLSKEHSGVIPSCDKTITKHEPRLLCSHVLLTLPSAWSLSDHFSAWSSSKSWCSIAGASVKYRLFFPHKLGFSPKLWSINKPRHLHSDITVNWSLIKRKCLIKPHVVGVKRGPRQRWVSIQLQTVSMPSWSNCCLCLDADTVKLVMSKVHPI